jgi:hypothetical protein
MNSIFNTRNNNLIQNKLWQQQPNPSVTLTENEMRNCIYDQIEYMIMDELCWNNDMIHADHEDIDRFILTEKNISFAKGIQQLRELTHIVFDHQFEHGVRWKVLPKGIQEFASYDGCFTLQYKIPTREYNWSSPYIHSIDLDDDEHTIWF